MLRGRCACQRLTLGRPENEGVAEAGLAKSCLGPGVDLPAGVAELSSRGTVPCDAMYLSTDTHRQPRTELRFSTPECICRQMKTACRQIHSETQFPEIQFSA
ncbi:hypothetical protein Taro_006422 [Colocasia esculenta]|uniref:Uncharacterized protein n=1 Tax=Colocasia esculenta TaxID=4460 RepID=A0A843TV88_COLES|nr:hypothetical protein [Colocasia esculenta]